MAISRTLARPLLGAIFFVGGYQAFKNPQAVAGKARRLTDRLVPLAREHGIPLPEDPETLVRLNAGTQLLAAAALATGRLPRLSSGVLVATLVPTTLAGHAFWEESSPHASRSQARGQVGREVPDSLSSHEIPSGGHLRSALRRT